VSDEYEARDVGQSFVQFRVERFQLPVGSFQRFREGPFVVLMIFATSCTNDTAELDAAFRKALETARAASELPGVTAAYRLPDGSVRRFAAGVADLDTGEPLRPDARMLAGSVGKTFVSATALQLVAEGRLELDTPIGAWLGGEPWFDRLRGAEAMTLRHLLCHSAGVYDHLSDPGFLKVIAGLTAPGADPDACPSHLEIVSYLLDRDPYFPAGTGFHYTDGGYLLVGLIIEKAIGRPFYDEARERFLEPLGLDLTSRSDHRDLPGLVMGHLQPGNPFDMPERTLVDGMMNHNPALEWTGGGFITNPGDLVEWASRLYAGEVLDAALREELLRTVPWDPEAPEGLRYGLGVIVEATDLGETWGHSGWYPGYHSKVAYDPRRGFAVAVQVNRDYDTGLGTLVQALAGTVADHLEGRETR